MLIDPETFLQAAARVLEEIPASFQPPAQPVVPALAEFGKRSPQLLQNLKYLTQTFFYFDQSGLPITLNELAPGVVHVMGPSHHSLLVEMKDYLVLMDTALYYPERSEAPLSAIKARYPGKQIGYIITSHFHSDHVGGIRHFVADGGVTVLAGAPSVPFYQRVFSNPHTVRPDRLALNSIHTNDTLIVYLPKEKILFVADLFNPGLFPATQAAPYVWGAASGGLYDEVRRLDLDVQMIAGGHGAGTGTMEALRITGGR